MSNYTKLTAYDTKDALSTGDPLKRIKGTELDDEFDAIATAIATKADTTSPSFTTPVLGTPTSGTLTNCTGLPIVDGTTGTLSVARGGTGATSLTSGALLKGAGTGAISVASAADIVAQIGSTAVANATNGGVTSVNAKTGAVQSVITQGTSTSASGTVVDFTGIPSWAKRITVMFNSASTDGTSVVVVRLGTSSGITDSGYTGVGITASSGGSWNIASNTTGLIIESGSNNSASYARIGSAVFVNQGGNNWVGNYQGVQTSANFGQLGTTIVGLSGVLDRVRITTINGTDAFDAGSINILYE